MYRIPDPILGWKLKPKTSYLYHLKEGTVRVTYNSKGWRDIEHSQVKNPPGTIRIAILGDSFMEGYSVGDNDYFARRLENLFNKESKKAEVFNFGVGGYGPLQYYLTFEHAVKPYHPNLVLVGIYLGNDIINSSYELESMQPYGQKTVDSRPFLYSQKQSQFKVIIKNYDKAVRVYKRQRVYNSSVLYRTLRRVYGQRIAPIFSTQEKENKQTGVTSKLDHCKAYKEAWNTFERILRKLKTETAKANVTLVLFSVPEFDFLTHPQENGCSGALPREKLSLLANKTGIPYINLYPNFEDEMSKNGTASVFRASDLHWNEHGHALAARIVYKALRDRNLVP